MINAQRNANAFEIFCGTQILNTIFPAPLKKSFYLSENHLASCFLIILFCVRYNWVPNFNEAN